MTNYPEERLRAYVTAHGTVETSFPIDATETWEEHTAALQRARAAASAWTSGQIQALLDAGQVPSAWGDSIHSAALNT